MRDQQLSKLVEFGRVWWNDNRNYRKEARPDGNIKALLQSMTPGWNSNSDPVIAMKLGCLDFDEAEVKVALEFRQKGLEALTLGATSDASLRFKLQAFRMLYCDSHGKLIVPQYAASSCFGRQSVYLDAVAKFLALKDKQSKMTQEDLERLKWSDPTIPLVKDLEPVLQVPCVIYDFASEFERLECQVKENERKLVGNLPPNDLDTFRAAVTLFRTQLLPESYFRQTFNATRGVKYYSICFLNNRFPDLRIIDRILSEPTAAGHIPLKSVDYRMVQSFKVRILTQEGVVTRKGKDQLPIEVEEITKYFGDPKAETVRPKQVLNTDVWKSLSEAEPNIVVRKMAVGHLSNNQDFMVKTLRPNADVFNLVLELIESGRSEIAKTVLMQIKSGVDYPKIMAEHDALKAGYDTLLTEKKEIEKKVSTLDKLLASANDQIASLTDKLEKVKPQQTSNKKPARV